MLYINISRGNKLSLSRQIYCSIKENVLHGKIPAGTKLPSSRELSAELNVARNVVIESYEQLIAEGYAFSKSGSGTYISEGVFLPVPEREICLHRSTTVSSEPSISVSFRTGIPDLTQIPIKNWGQIYHKTALDVKPHQLDYQNPLGDNSLRLTLARYLNRVRGTDINPENILLTNGAAQSFNLLCQLVLPHEYALVENPLSNGIMHTLKSNGVSIKPIRLDACGMVTAELPIETPKLIFTTPSHQFPTGAILPISRRIELIHYARRNNCYIVEDDYDSEYRFDGNPVESMQSMAPDRVIYVGSFSKTFMPALRVGYMVLPDVLREKMCGAKYVSDIHSPILEQLTLARFIESGAFELHIQKMKKLYRRKRNILINCLKKTFGDQVTISGSNAGLHLVASFNRITFDVETLNNIQQAGLEIASVNKHMLNSSIETQYNNALVFGYGNTPIDEIEIGVDLLSSAVGKTYIF